MFDAFRAGLRDLGYIEDRNIILEFRLARGNLSLGPQLAAELVALPVDIIVRHNRGRGALAGMRRSVPPSRCPPPKACRRAIFACVC